MAEIKDTEILETEDSTAKEEEVKAKQPDISELMIELELTKKKNDKLAKEAGEWRKKYNSTLSEKEQLDAIKAEEDARFREEYEDMKRQLTVSKYRENFITLGYSKELAEQAATAQFEGNIDVLFAVQQKAKEISEKTLKAELLRAMPVSPISNDGESITKEQFDKMDFSQRAKLYEDNPSLYKSLIS